MRLCIENARYCIFLFVLKRRSMCVSLDQFLQKKEVRKEDFSKKVRRKNRIDIVISAR